MPYLSSRDDRPVILHIYVQPRASRTGITGLHDGAVRLAITAPPVDGKANAQVTAFLARLFGLPRSALKIRSGLQGRNKRIAISGLSPEEVREVIEAHLDTPPTSG